MKVHMRSTSDMDQDQEAALSEVTRRASYKQWTTETSRPLLSSISSSKVMRWVGDAAAAAGADSTGETADDQYHEKQGDDSTDEVLDHEGTSLRAAVALTGR